MADTDDSMAVVPGGGPGSRPLGFWGIVLLGIYLASLAAISFFGLWYYWPRCGVCVGSQAVVRPASSSRSPRTGTIPTPASASSSAARPTPQSELKTEKSTADQSVLLSVSGVEPRTATTTGCDVVILVGTGFKDGMHVLFGGAESANIVVIASTVAKVTVPGHTAGKVGVDVIVDGVLSTLPEAFTYECALPSDGSIYLMVLLAGALGGTLHAVRSYFMYVGARKLIASWTLMYLLLPVTGAALALICFVIVTSGLWSAGIQPGLGIIGLAALVGMFNTEAIEKLRNVAEGLFTKVPASTEHLAATTGATSWVVLSSLTPVRQQGLQAGTDVRLTGTGFTTDMTVFFGDRPSTNLRVLSDTEAVVTAPDAATAGTVDVRIERPNKVAVRPQGYTYEG